MRHGKWTRRDLSKVSAASLLFATPSRWRWCIPPKGSPLIIVPSDIFSSAPNPNAARLFQNFLFSAEVQQMLVDVFAHRSFHAQVKEKGEHIPLANLKLLKADPAQVQAQSEQIKARYSKLFGV